MFGQKWRKAQNFEIAIEKGFFRRLVMKKNDQMHDKKVEQNAMSQRRLLLLSPFVKKSPKAVGTRDPFQLSKNLLLNAANLWWQEKKLFWGRTTVKAYDVIFKTINKWKFKKKTRQKIKFFLDKNGFVFWTTVMLRFFVCLNVDQKLMI